MISKITYTNYVDSCSRRVMLSAPLSQVGMGGNPSPTSTWKRMLSYIKVGEPLPCVAMGSPLPCVAMRSPLPSYDMGGSCAEF